MEMLFRYVWIQESFLFISK